MIEYNYYEGEGEYRVKKKFFTMFLVMVFAGLQITGCGKEEKKENSDKKTEITEEKTETTKEKTSTKEEEEEKKVEAKRGSITDDVYMNEVFGVNIPIPENATVYSDEQIVQMLGLDANILSEDKVYTAKDMEEKMEGVVYDAVIVFSDEASNVSVIYENREKSPMGDKTEEEYAEENAKQLEAAEGYGYIREGISKEKVGGTEFTVLAMKTDYYSQKYYLHTMDNYVIEFIVTYTEETKQEAEDLMSTIIFNKIL